MSSNETHADSSSGRTDHQSDDAVSRRELAVRLQLKELELVRLRRRVDWLETVHDHDPIDDTQVLRTTEDDLLNELDTIAGRSDE